MRSSRKWNQLFATILDKTVSPSDPSVLCMQSGKEWELHRSTITETERYFEPEM